MPGTDIRFYCQADGTAPVLAWLDELAQKNRRAYLKCREVIDRLALLGHELRRPTADHLENGVYESGPRKLPDSLFLSRTPHCPFGPWLNEGRRDTKIGFKTGARTQETI